MNYLEIEYKTLLTASEYQSLLPDFAHVEPVSQTNYYIDTVDFSLNKNRLSLRIRTVQDRAELTLKVPQEVGNFEYNQELDWEIAKTLLQNFQLPQGPIWDILSERGLPIKQLEIWGHLETLRYEMEHPIGLMALDKNHYEGILDYELEVEVKQAQQGKKDFDAFLKEKQIGFTYASSKVARCATQKKSVQ